MPVSMDPLLIVIFNVGKIYLKSKSAFKCGTDLKRGGGITLRWLISTGVLLIVRKNVSDLIFDVLNNHNNKLFGLI